MMVERLKQPEASYSSRDLLKILVKMVASWSTQTFRQAGETLSGPEALLDFYFLKTQVHIFYTDFKPGTHQADSRAVFVHRPTKFSQCVPHRRPKLFFVGRGGK